MENVTAAATAAAASAMATTAPRRGVVGALLRDHAEPTPSRAAGFNPRRSTIAPAPARPRAARVRLRLGRGHARRDDQRARNQHDNEGDEARAEDRDVQGETGVELSLAGEPDRREG